MVFASTGEIIINDVSGGYAYFDITLKALKQPASYFSLGNNNWHFIGLDTGYVDNNLNKEQMDWFAAQLGTGSAKTILLTHHQLFSAYEDTGDNAELSCGARTLIPNHRRRSARRQLKPVVRQRSYR